MHERYRRQTDGRTIAYSERDCEFNCEVFQLNMPPVLVQAVCKSRENMYQRDVSFTEHQISQAAVMCLTSSMIGDDGDLLMVKDGSTAVDVKSL